jgi:ubiquinone/menaquinone biosynthesis C-methylase UbiE
MDTISRFSSKAERYARYRWGYAPEAIQTIFDITGLPAQAIVADIGSGTGLLTKELVGRVKSIYAVEPNLAMRRISECLLSQSPSFISVDGKAEAIPLPDRSVNLITVGQAIHWFEPQATRMEFQRLLKPDGWVAIVFHTVTHQRVFETLTPFFTVDYGWDPTPSPRHGEDHIAYYLDNDSITKKQFGQSWQENWETFIGGILSDSHAPDDTHRYFPKFVAAAREIFDQYSDGGFIKVNGGTDLAVGRLRKETNG